MNILIFSWRDIKHPLAGGAEQVMHEHAKGWVAAGHKVTHFSSQVSGLQKEAEIDGIKFIRTGNQYLAVQWAGFKYFLKNKKEIDFVVDEFHGIPFFTPFFIRTPKLAVVQETAREVWFLNPLKFPRNLIVGSIGYLLEPFIFLLYKSTNFMTGSESAKKDVSRFGIPAKNITVVPHGVITLDKGPNLKKEKTWTLMYLGIITKDKGIEDALKTFQIIKDESKKPIQFWIIGKPETEEYMLKLKQMVKDLRLGNWCKFWGFVSQDKKFELLSRGHILVNPSVREGWGLVNIEANSMGTPVVSFNSRGLIDSVKDNYSGIICKQNIPKEMAKIVLELSEDEKRYQNLQKTALSWSKNFNWENSRKKSLDLIKRITHES